MKKSAPKKRRTVKSYNSERILRIAQRELIEFGSIKQKTKRLIIGFVANVLGETAPAVVKKEKEVTQGKDKKPSKNDIRDDELNY